MLNCSLIAVNIRATLFYRDIGQILCSFEHNFVAKIWYNIVCTKDISDISFV